MIMHNSQELIVELLKAYDSKGDIEKRARILYNNLPDFLSVDNLAHKTMFGVKDLGITSTIHTPPSSIKMNNVENCFISKQDYQFIRNFEFAVVGKKQFYLGNVRDLSLTPDRNFLLYDPLFKVYSNEESPLGKVALEIARKNETTFNLRNARFEEGIYSGDKFSLDFFLEKINNIKTSQTQLSKIFDEELQRLLKYLE